MVQIKRMLDLRFRISIQLYAAFGMAVALTVAASLIALLSFQNVGSAQAKVNEGSVPEMEAAFGVAQYGSALVAAAPRLTNATTPEDLEVVWQEILATGDKMQSNLEALDQANADPVHSDRISGYWNGLDNYIQTIHSNVDRGLELNSRADYLADNMLQIRTELEEIINPAVDDAYFFIITGRTEIGKLPLQYSQHFSEEQVDLYRHMTSLQADSNIALQQLSNVFGISDAALVEAHQERFESAVARIRHSLIALNDRELEEQLTPLYRSLEQLGLAADGVFVVMQSKLQLEVEQDRLLVLSRVQSANLVDELNSLVTAAVASAEEATQASDSAISTGSTLVIVISILSIILAVLISWLFVGKVLLRRIRELSNRMRRLADGDLEGEVDVQGEDELAEMAAALEVFRHNTREALRLNLVEELNRELEGKNSELEVVLAELQNAQDQIVMREKLAALGEVTAGVAHEIRNPLNFVKNFSEASGELLVELREVLDEEGEVDMDYVGEIANDLNDNLERIRHHGARADRIVNDMLLFGRGSTNFQDVDLNGLLMEHALLAFHAARANDTEFQLTLEEDLDQDLGDIKVIPQDLGRCILNIVGNACQATDERRRALAEVGIGFKEYSPTVWIQTRGQGDNVEIRVRDNGPGIPQDVIEKVFNPFFTTKPTNQGTGLGLAITSDIIREHGGSIHVESEPGDYTEMIIVIPKSPPAAVEEQDDDDD